MPGSFTQLMDSMYATTWMARKSEIVDNIFKSEPFFAWLTTKGNMESRQGGQKIEDNLLYAENNTFSSIAKGGKVATTPVDELTVSRWDWKTLAGSIVRYRDEEFKNRGKAAIANRVSSSVKTAEKSASKEFTRQVFLDGTGNGGLELDGLASIVAEDPTTGTVGSINAATNTWWRNQYQDMASFAFSTYGPQKMNTMVNDCTEGNITPDLILTSQEVWEYYHDEVQSIQTVMQTNTSPLADLGFQVLKYKGIDMLFDKNMPVTDRMYFLSSETLKIIKSDVEWFEMTAWENVPQQPKDRIAYILATCNLVCNARRNNGVMFNIVQ